MTISIADTDMSKLEGVSSCNWDIYIAGDLDVARQVCREYCMAVGMCVNISPTEFIYTGGSETGVRVGFINYPRFPLRSDDLKRHAKTLADLLMERLCQHSYSLVDPTGFTYWVSRRPA